MTTDTRTSPRQPIGTPLPANAPGAIDYGLLLLLASLWGGSFLLIKVGVSEIPPFTLTAMRLCAALLLLFCAMLAMRVEFPRTKRAWQLIVTIAVVGTTLPFFLISWGQQFIASGIAAILMGVMPLTTMLLAHILVPDDRLSIGKFIGVLFGFAGVCVLVGPQALVTLGDSVFGQLAIAAAATCYGASAVATRRMMGTTSQLGLATCVMLTSCLIMVPFALLIDGVPTDLPSSGAIASVLTLGFVQTGLAQLLLFAIVARQGPSFFSQINFIIPIIGVFWGAIFLGERLPAAAFVALAFILAGLAVARSRA